MKRNKRINKKKDYNGNFIFFIVIIVCGAISFTLNPDDYLEGVFLPVVYGFGILIIGVFVFGILPDIIGSYKIVKKKDDE